MRYGGRKHPADGFGECCGEWRHNRTEYKRWTGSAWTNVETKGASNWRATGSPGNLAYHTFGDDIDLHGGALVRQRLQYRRFRMVGNQSAWLTVGGDWNNHFLE